MQQPWWGAPEVQGLGVGLMMLLLRMLLTVIMIMMRLLNTNTNDDHNDGRVRRFIRRGGEVHFPALEDSFRIWGLGFGIQCSGSSYYEILCSDALEKQETLLLRSWIPTRITFAFLVYSDSRSLRKQGMLLMIDNTNRPLTATAFN